MSTANYGRGASVHNCLTDHHITRFTADLEAGWRG